MLERDMLTKPCPQRWQDLSVKELQGLDVVLCFDDRIFEIVLEDLQLRGAAGGPGGPGNEPTTAWRPLHVLCLDTKDTPEHAKVGGSLALELCQAVRLSVICSVVKLKCANHRLMVKSLLSL